MAKRLHNSFWIYFLLAGLFFLGSVSVRAAMPQGPGGQRRGMPSADQRMQMLNKQLNLTSDEQAKIKPILEDEQKKMEDLRNDSTLSRQDRFQKMRAIHQDASKQIRSNLDDSQQKKFDDMQKKQQEQMQQRRNRGGCPGPGAGLDS